MLLLWQTNLKAFSQLWRHPILIEIFLYFLTDFTFVYIIWSKIKITNFWCKSHLNPSTFEGAIRENRFTLHCFHWPKMAPGRWRCYFRDVTWWSSGEASLKKQSSNRSTLDVCFALLVLHFWTGTRVLTCCYKMRRTPTSGRNGISVLFHCTDYSSQST